MWGMALDTASAMAGAQGLDNAGSPQLRKRGGVPGWFDARLETLCSTGSEAISIPG